ncbi:hypothetical protein [Aliirhizobium cellulosilyticum]|uniref:Trp operon repressor n=1 Tax=Aliirhizobium cellulosilyticum TaxID=393664 RepID=A0A7W6WP31_9HYPH|nr:hypothetical protein [Rhizobium cellulosilyticum]MBB4347973.1 Trp operon repressor [Rhizobium cellulosilyticum]MBB4409633.1 Trp operon repressor [Rhizobium cellulosilyticum]MBB4444321.1 Trp operon repressor [Rhizobium cellulosilyticum]
MSNVVSLHDHQTRAWETYIEAMQRAQSSGAIEDGIAAGRAWRRWLDLFMTPEQRQSIGSRVAG